MLVLVCLAFTYGGKGFKATSPRSPMRHIRRATLTTGTLSLSLTSVRRARATASRAVPVEVDPPPHALIPNCGCQLSAITSAR